MSLRSHHSSAATGLPAAAAGVEAYRRFCDPRCSPHLSPMQAALVARARVHLNKAMRRDIETPAGRVPIFEFPPLGAPSGRTVLLVHGWTSEAAFMAAFVDPLRQKGVRVIAFDFPAHGYSAARLASMIDCARAMLAVTDAVGRIDAVVAHSIGSLVTSLVVEGGPPMSRGVAFPRLVLVASPNRLEEITRDFGRHLGLQPASQRWYERQVERVGRRELRSFSVVRMLADYEGALMVVHSRDDRNVPFENAREIATGLPKARLHAVDHLGHARVLYAPPVVRAVRDFVLGD